MTNAVSRSHDMTKGAGWGADALGLGSWECVAWAPNKEEPTLKCWIPEDKN
jgi:hypothetical protein